jgi:hypothetical protein
MMSQTLVPCQAHKLMMSQSLMMSQTLVPYQAHKLMMSQSLMMSQTLVPCQVHKPDLVLGPCWMLDACTGDAGAAHDGQWLPNEHYQKLLRCIVWRAYA